MDAAPAVTLSHAAWGAIRQEALRAFPEEGCGFLVGPRGAPRVDEARPMPNVHPGPRERRFVIDGLAYVRLEDELEATGRALAGIFHSHPLHPPLPSETDRAVAWPGLLYLIQSVDGPSESALRELRAWRVRELGGAFEALRLDVRPRP